MTLRGNGWWTICPIRNGIADIVVRIPGLGRRQGTLLTTDEGDGVCIAFVIRGITELQQYESDSLNRLLARATPVKAWHDREVATVHLSAFGRMRLGDSIESEVSWLVAHVTQAFRENVTRALEARSARRRSAATGAML